MTDTSNSNELNSLSSAKSSAANSSSSHLSVNSSHSITNANSISEDRKTHLDPANTSIESNRAEPGHYQSNKPVLTEHSNSDTTNQHLNTRQQKMSQELNRSLLTSNPNDSKTNSSNLKNYQKPSTASTKLAMTDADQRSSKPASDTAVLFDSTAPSISYTKGSKHKKDGNRPTPSTSKTTATTSSNSTTKKSTPISKSSDQKDKKKLVVACIACRKKKIKCSSDRPACSNCLRLNILCEYPVVRNRGSRFGYMGMLNRRLNHLEKYINCSTNPQYHPQFVKIHQKPRKNDSESSSDSKESSSSHNPLNSKDSASSTISKNITEQITKLASDTPQITPPVTNSRDSSITDGIELPPLEVIVHLADLYFRHVHGQTYSFLHKPTFIPRIYKSQVNKGLVLALCGLTARFSRHPAVASRIPYLAGESFVSKARRVISMEFDDPTLETVQAMILLIQHDFFRSKGKKSMIYISMAIRMATTLGLHEEPTDPNLTFLEREQRRRTYWSLVVLDRLGHSSSHWQVQLRADLAEIQMPCTDYCFENCIPVVTQKLNGDTPADIKLSGAASHPQYPNGKLGLYAYIVKVTILWCDINKYVIEGHNQESVPPWEPGSKFNVLETRLQNLFAELPKEYQYSRERLVALDAVNQGGALVHLHGELLMSLCYLNRVMYPYNYKKMQFDTQPPDSFVERAALNIMASAKAQSSMIEDVLMMEDFNMAPFVGFGVFALSSVHIANSFSSDEVVSTAAKNNLAINLKFLVIMREYWYSVGVWCIVLKDRYFQKAQRHKLRLEQLKRAKNRKNSNESTGGLRGFYANESGNDNEIETDDEENDGRAIPDGFSRPGTPPLAYAPDGFMNVASNKPDVSNSSSYSSPGALSSSSSTSSFVNGSLSDGEIIHNSNQTNLAGKRSLPSDPKENQSGLFESNGPNTKKAKTDGTLTPQSSAFANTWSKALQHRRNSSENREGNAIKSVNSSSDLLRASKYSKNTFDASVGLSRAASPSQFIDILTMHGNSRSRSINNKNLNIHGNNTKPALPTTQNSFEYANLLDDVSSENTLTDANDDYSGPTVIGVSSNSRNNLLTDISGEWLKAIDPCDFQQLTDNKNLDNAASIGWANNDIFAGLLNNSGKNESNEKGMIEEEDKEEAIHGSNSNMLIMAQQHDLQQLLLQNYQGQESVILKNENFETNNSLSKDNQGEIHNDESDGDSNNDDSDNDKAFLEFGRSSKLRTLAQDKSQDMRVVDESLFKNSILHQPFAPEMESPSHELLSAEGQSMYLSNSNVKPALHDFRREPRGILEHVGNSAGNDTEQMDFQSTQQVLASASGIRPSSELGFQRVNSQTSKLIQSIDSPFKQTSKMDDLNTGIGSIESDSRDYTKYSEKTQEKKSVTNPSENNNVETAFSSSPGQKLFSNSSLTKSQENRGNSLEDILQQVGDIQEVESEDTDTFGNNM